MRLGLTRALLFFVALIAWSVGCLVNSLVGIFQCCNKKVLGWSFGALNENSAKSSKKEQHDAQWRFEYTKQHNLHFVYNSFWTIIAIEWEVVASTIHKMAMVLFWS